LPRLTAGGQEGPIHTIRLHDFCFLSGRGFNRAVSLFFLLPLQRLGLLLHRFLKRCGVITPAAGTAQAG
jgi:hypothetical protein